MTGESSFQDLLKQLQRGDQDAATKIYERYAQQLIAKARIHLGTRLQHKVDAEDLVQSVYRSFFHRFDQGQYELENWESLWGLLILITLRKCGRKINHFYANKRDINREIEPNIGTEESARHWEAIAREPTPEEAAVLTETMEHFLETFNPRQRKIITLFLQGYTQQEISSQVGCSERTVRRVLDLARIELNA